MGVAYEMRRGSITDMVRHQGALEELDAMRLFIRSHMDDVPDNNDGWIPVEERLPEDERMVLVTCQTKKGLGVQTGHIMTESFGMEAVRCQA